ncbi:hypothetical protein CSOJ01_09963 [Colletotrichum sojae]|uniref:C2H2-type domain-containing protein n=1 Tax=Colletotrichum sojae TaxID=2175907 RepID=A0A8H6J235_9PEZI|nr:hypothetical protein CSOJ01_09963 [Colletotrichum sojae]
MAAAFRPVNSPLPMEEAKIDDATTSLPTAMRPSTAPHPQTPQPSTEDVMTPTRATFANGGLASQRPLPSSPFPQAVQVPESAEQAKTPTRANSQHSRKSRDSEDVDMDESDGEGAGDDGAGSDDESVNADGTRSNKKKKSQRFFCTDYPPCNLSFTRSEHLARHIRKHTGERPFQCHCSRRFSRLDNLRQHAQTVHVNEDIPIDSLAATGSRFQRQMRTERVRQQGGRSRANTAGAGPGPVRGHSKSLSTSSIASVGSLGPAFGVGDEIRRRPAPLVMADPRARVSVESYRSDVPYGYRQVSPTDYGSPTSATFSNGQSSPQWGSGITSPTAMHTRSQSMYSTGLMSPGRRLSVPSGANPFQSPHGVPLNNANRHMYGGPVNASNNGAFSPAPSSHLASPTTPTSAWTARRDSTSSTADEAWRRRTWHPDTRNFNTNTSHLSNVLSSSQLPPDHAPPIASAQNPQQTLRLPGIESFDPLPPNRRLSPPRRLPSPMAVDSDAAYPPAPVRGPVSATPERKNMAQLDMGLHRGLTRLDITNTTPPRDSAGAWANEVNRAVQAQAEQVRAEHVRLNPPTVRFEAEPPSYASSVYTRNHQHTMSAPSFAVNRDSKRHGWYHGPSNSHIHGPRPGPPGQDARGLNVNRIVHPNMSAFSGFPARHAEPQPAVPQHPHDRQDQLQQHHQRQPQPGVDRGPNPDPMKRLEALVAVATSEGTTATAY